MATNSLSSRLEDLRSRNPQSPPSERAYSGYSTPNSRYSGNFGNTMHSHSQSVSNTTDPRSNSMQRRFTADSNNFPTALSPITYQNMNQELSTEMNTYHKAQAIDKKRIELEKLREQKQRMEEEFRRLHTMQQERESEITRLSNDIQTMNFPSGHQSEPTTPPEYRDQSYHSSSSSVYGNRNRFSSASLTSPPGTNRMSRSGSQVASPPNELAHQNGDDSKFPSQSNRYSMPVTLSNRQKRESVADYPPMGLSQIDTTSTLFDDDDEHELVTSPAVKSYLQAHTTDDKFPVLLRNNHKPGTLSASSAALDLANLQANSIESKTESKSNGWPPANRSRHQSQQSVPQNTIDGGRFNRSSFHSPTGSQQSVDTVVESPAVHRGINRHSLESTLASLTSPSNHALYSSNNNNINGSSARPGLSGMQSYSTNDIPTVKNNSNNGTHSSNLLNSPPSTADESKFHKHNASLGRIPGGNMNNRLSRDLATGDILADEPPRSVRNSLTSTELQASAAPFGPSLTTSMNSNESSSNGSSELPQYNGQNFFPYGMSMLNMGMTPMQIAAMNGGNFGGNSMQYYPQPTQQGQSQTQTYSSYGQYNPGGRFNDSQQKVIQQRRTQNAEGNRRVSRRSSGAHSDPDTARFTNTKIETYAGEIYSLCKDQHGCRYLQKQLETRHPETVQMIFAETAPHVIELMTDPFGNYLCQKLLEHTNDAQRTVLVENAAPHMMQIALNQHGTRALQKMIEYLSTNEQITVVRNALADKVVELIQDLNGNHVIQKCLNRLTSEDSQFIFDAVGKNCVVVGTHRHGCCVLQRCIDHASGNQKADLIAQITSNAFKLVQDPYGNYVLQYIIDLNDTNFTDPLCYSFQTRVVELSKHKFSSNVIEKCIRHAAPSVSSMMIDEMLGATDIERMLRDSFANYVVQTALDCAEPEARARLVEAIRPILPSIRHTPHGRRIQSKVLQSENSSQGPSPVMSPTPGHPQIRGPGPMIRNSSATHQKNSYYQTQQQPTPYGMNGYGSQPGFAQMVNGQMNGHFSNPNIGHSNGQFQGHRAASNGGFQHFNPLAPQNGMHQGVQQQNYGRSTSSGMNFF